MKPCDLGSLGPPARAIMSRTANESVCAGRGQRYPTVRTAFADQPRLQGLGHADLQNSLVGRILGNGLDLLPGRSNSFLATLDGNLGLLPIFERDHIDLSARVSLQLGNGRALLADDARDARRRNLEGRGLVVLPLVFDELDKLPAVLGTESRLGRLRTSFLALSTPLRGPRIEMSAESSILGKTILTSYLLSRR
jgi:hypothetical protein